MGLEYDNAAWYYFAIAMLSLYIFPATLLWIRYLRNAGNVSAEEAKAVARARSELEKQKIKELQKKKSASYRLLTWSNAIQFMILVSLWYAFVNLLLLVADDSEVASFDPFAILSVDKDATPKEIKKAYRAAALMWHPDKHPQGSDTHEEANDMFSKIAKAYEALTDPIAMENYAKYGNPDGRQSMAVSIGLPTWAADADNAQIIMLMYLAGMVVVIPLCVGLYYNNSKKFGAKMVRHESYDWYIHMLNEHSFIRQLPEVLAGSAEFRELNNKDSYRRNKDELDRLAKKFKASGALNKMKYNHPTVVKGTLLLVAYLQNVKDELSPGLQSDLHDMLEHCPKLLNAMIELSWSRKWLQTTINVLTFAQNITQGLSDKHSSLLQLPHFTDSEVKHCTSGKKGSVSGSNAIQTFINMPNDEKKGISRFSDEEKQDVFRVCELIPNVEFEAKIFVDVDADEGDDTRIATGDIITLEAILTRKNVAEGEKAEPVHAPNIPVELQEIWWVMLVNQQGMPIVCQKVESQDRVVSEKIKFQAPPKVGPYTFEVFMKSASYMGVDQKATVKIDVIDAAELPKWEVHPDDRDLDNEPTLFEEMMQAQGGDESDSDSDSDDDDDEGLTEAEKRRKAKRIAAKESKSAGNSDDSDDSDSDDDDDDDEGVIVDPSDDEEEEDDDDDDEDGELVD